MRHIVLLVSVIALCFELPSAGQLDPQLAADIAGKPADQLVKVWIQLPSTENSKAFKNSLAQQSSSLALQHSTAIEHFKLEHKAAQRNLLSYLRTLPKNKAATNIKAHWLVNMVEAEVPVSDLAGLAARPDVETIYAVPRITSVLPVESFPAPVQTTSVQQNLTYVHAPDAWAAGYTGIGRTVCSFDTGVDGSHPALHDNWKGLDGDSAAAWFDPAKQLPYPHSISNCGYSPCNTSHGTHVMGIMVGHTTTDTLGVAPAAKWMSAAVIDIAGVSIVDAFEWAADPDGDPNTIGDMPDVINHSWGIKSVPCQNLFYDLIDNIEALGVVNVFSAGNEGSAVSSIRNPADRDLDSLDCFAVGNINSSTSIIDPTSSRGPSTCNGHFKPNVVAPGVAITSSIPGGLYGVISGTSMAAPHVSGLVALLRQKNPNATVDEIKKAILTSTDHLGHALPDNNYGWGLIDCMAALNALPPNNPSTPDLKVYRFDHAPISPGDTVTGYVWLKNAGSSVSSVTASLVAGNIALSILDGADSYGTLTAGDTVRSLGTYQAVVSDTVTVGSVLSLDFDITGSGYNVTRQLYFSVVPPTERTFITLNSGHIQFSVSDFGTFGFAGTTASESFFPLNGAGFNFTNFGNDLYEGGLMIGIDDAHVSDGIRNAAGEPDGDFGVSPGGNITLVPPKPTVTEQTSAAFSDDRAENPIGLSLTQNTYAYNYDPFQDFIILQYIIRNDSAVTRTNVYVGVYTDWDIPQYYSNSGGFDVTNQFNWTAYYNGSTLTRYRGVKIVQGGTATGFTQSGNLVLYPNLGNGFTETEKMQSLSDGFIRADSFKTTTNPKDLLQITAARINSMAPGQVDTIAFAFLAGTTFGDITNAAINAQDAYLTSVTDVNDEGPDGNLPIAFALHQNYPNPFNPTTTIGFSLARASNYTLTIYNIAGQKVHEVTGSSRAGEVEIEWDARTFASGIYLYRLTAGNRTDSKKMLLLK